MTIVNTIDLDTIHLDSGGHNAKKPGEWCVMEAVAWVAGELWTDRPACVSPVISRYCIRLNDRLGDEDRQKLAPYIFKLIGTNTGPEDDEQRRLLASAKFTELLPAWLDAADLAEQADRVRALGPLTTYEQWTNARAVLRSVSDTAWKKRNERRDAIRVAATVAAAAAVADAVADAVAVAVAATVAAAAAAAAAAADAVADAATVADAVAVAVAATVADAAADAAADADAVAAADAVAVADAAPWGTTYTAVYAKVKPIYEQAIADNPVLSALVERSRTAAFELLDEMCAVGRD